MFRRSGLGFRVHGLRYRVKVLEFEVSELDLPLSNLCIHLTTPVLGVAEQSLKPKSYSPNPQPEARLVEGNPEQSTYEKIKLFQTGS